MRIVYLVLLIVLAGIAVLFALQNLQLVTVSFLNWKLTLPVALVIAGAFLLGVASGGSVLAFLRWTVSRARKPSGR
jgi:uncharacterized integral membrane protein